MFYRHLRVGGNQKSRGKGRGLFQQSREELVKQRHKRPILRQGREDIVQFRISGRDEIHSGFQLVNNSVVRLVASEDDLLAVASLDGRRVLRSLL